MNTQLRGIFAISLDFELHWGGFEKWRLPPVSGFESLVVQRFAGVSSSGLSKNKAFHPVRKGEYIYYFLNTRQVIPEMLKLFDRHEVHVTWATVGILFHKDKTSLLNHLPQMKPSYEVSELSAYNYMIEEGIGEDEDSDPFHYAASLIQKIVQTPFQELGTHTFAHYYCNEAGQTPEQFRADLKAAVKSAELFGIKLRSLVFPRNQFNQDYLRICFEEGITSVRTNPLDWFWKIDSTQSESLWKRLNRGLDAYYPVGKKNTYRIDSIETREGYPLFIPASRLLRPFNPKEYFLNSSRINRIRSEMTRAAKHGEVYHLWWHPHNFGRYPEQSLDGLKEILGHYDWCREQFGMQSMNMGEISQSILESISNRQ